MKIVFEKPYLVAALKAVGQAVSRRNTLPVLKSLLLETESDRLTLTATDLDTTIRCSIPVTVNEPGAASIPYALLKGAIGQMPDAPTEIDARGTSAFIRSGCCELVLLTEDVGNYPVVKFVEEGREIRRSQAALKEMLHLTTFAASKEETRSILMGALLEAQGKSFRVVATDTHRLALAHSVLDEEIEEQFAVIVPAKTLNILGKFLKKLDDSDVVIRHSGSYVQFEVGPITVVSRTLDGQFPNYEKVIPVDLPRKLTFDRIQCLSALRRSFIIAKQNSEKITFVIENGLLKMSANSNDVGRVREEIPVRMEGDALTIAFNGRYLIAVLSILDADEITFELSGALNPGIVSSPALNFKYVLMPMQV